MAQCQKCHAAYASKQEIWDAVKTETGEGSTSAFRNGMYYPEGKLSETYKNKLLPPDFTRHPIRAGSSDSDAFWTVTRADVLDRLPEKIGQYRVTGLLGVGGMGVVYLAEQGDPHRTVALKVMHSGRMSRESRQRFQHEVRVLSHLRHPSIAQIFDAGTSKTDQGAQPFFAMEHIDGQGLTTYVREKKLSTVDTISLLARARWPLLEAA